MSEEQAIDVAAFPGWRLSDLLDAHVPQVRRYAETLRSDERDVLHSVADLMELAAERLRAEGKP